MLPVRIELTTSPLPRGCSTTELRQPGAPANSLRARRRVCHTPRGRSSKAHPLAPTRKAPSRLDAVIGSLVFLVAAPGTVAGFVPWVISRWTIRAYPGDEILRPVGVALISLGGLVLLEAFARFALQGRGTPAPIYPADRLIVGGTYRFVRNPMYLAVEALILGQAGLFGTVDLVIYGAMIAVGFHFFVVWVEEPTLKRHYPKAYRRYADAVRRWLPRLTPWRPGPAVPEETKPPAPPSGKDDARFRRAERLGAALRQNLKRRKAAAAAKRPPPARKPPTA